MRPLRTQDRDNSMEVPISFQGVPMFRGIAFAIDHIEGHGAKVDIFSADRRHDVISEHNTQFHTHLSSQEQLIWLASVGRGNPANPTNRTSHCLYADDVIGRLLHIPVGGILPWWALGIDLSDRGAFEDVSHFLSVSRRLGYKFVQPYAGSGRELHHVILTESPTRQLERWNVISQNRRAA